ncbi:MAG: hydrogenobyrinic acid a,c-diamide synthase (glutamine-hydrolyzing) [Deltaproteobacteria bacterium]
MLPSSPRIIISALKGGSGKTIISLGLATAWRKKGYRVAPFKKGPDFIDAGWLSVAAGRPCHNLDPFFMTPQQIIQSFLMNSADADLSVIEGNRGLFDGLDLEGCCSTAELGRILKSPVVLIVDVTMATRTVAALVMGCQKFDPHLNIAAVILNRVAGSRQESLIRNAIDEYCGLPVIGAIPKLKGSPFPERHMGLVPHLESRYSEKAIEWAGAVVEGNIDLPVIWKLAHAAEVFERIIENRVEKKTSRAGQQPLRIGVVTDRAFWFYYPENLKQLEAMGAHLVQLNSMIDRGLPDLDALYIGGGFPETQAESLAANRAFKESLRRMVDRGLPVYAECGGLMYLGESLVVDGKTYPMVGALPIVFVLEKKPQGHGYTILEVVGQNPYYPVGAELKGHEFHYSRPVIRRPEDITSVFSVRRGRGLDGKKDGLCTKNLLATYTHLHAGGNALWGPSLFNAGLRYRSLHARNFSEHHEKGD